MLYKICKRIVYDKCTPEYQNISPREIGVRPSENLSPFLFALLLNDLEDFMNKYDILDYNFVVRWNRKWIKFIYENI